MKRRIGFLVAAAALCGTVHASGQEAPGAAFLADTRRHLERLERLGFAGTVLVARGDEVLLAEGYGWANRESSIPWTPETVSTVGSITKQFTAAAILALEEDGKLRVDDPISKHLPDVPAAKQKITLHHLLTHTSGLVDAFPYDDFDAVDRDLLLKLALQVEPAHAPGAGFTYSNVAYSLLGLVVERASGMAYEAYLRERLFARAGMEDTGYMVGWERTRLAQGYVGRERWGTFLERPRAGDGPFWMLRANGGMHSTGRDMVRWCRALLEDRVLRPESRRRMWTGTVDDGGGSLYGYGWVVTRGADGTPVVTHNGGNGIFFADLGIVPESRTVIFLMTNILADFPGAEELLGEIESRLLAGTPYPEVPEIVDMGLETLVGFAGNYELPSGGRIAVRMMDGGLTFVPQGTDAWRALYLPAEPESLLAARHGILREVLAGLLADDYRPMWEAYDRRVPLESLEQGGRALLRSIVMETGPLQRFEILGSAPLEQGMATFVRLDGDRNSIYRQYIWTPAGRLFGYRAIPWLQIPAFYPVSGDRFLPYGSRVALTTPGRFERGANGRWVLVLGEGGAELRVHPSSGR